MTAPEGLEELAERVEKAAERLAPHLPSTPLRRSFWLSDMLEAEVWLKCEILQPTGSFKVRGALNRLLGERTVHHVVAASTGNHGAAVAFATERLAAQSDVGRTRPECTVFVPEGTASAKLTTMRRLGADIRVVGSDSLESELAARTFSEVEGALYVSPYNDPMVVAGQGTAGVEIDAQLQAAGAGPADVVVAALGGGGLISGLAAWFRREGRTTVPHIVAASPDHSKVMVESVRAGRVLDLPSRPTLSDGTAGGVEPGAITFDWVRTGVDEFALVSEEKIASIVASCLAEERLLVEGAAAVAIGATADPGLRERVRGATVVIVLCGANLAVTKLVSILQQPRFAPPAAE